MNSVCAWLENDEFEDDDSVVYGKVTSGIYKDCLLKLTASNTTRTRGVQAWILLPTGGWSLLVDLQHEGNPDVAKKKVEEWLAL